MEEKILSMYAKGMTTGDIESHMREMYDIDLCLGGQRGRYNVKSSCVRTHIAL